MGSKVVVQAGDKANKKKRIKHYYSNQQILLVGEGDFSFAACLARAFGCASNVVATSLDSEANLPRKHPTAVANLVELKNMGCTVILEVDACKMYEHPLLKRRLFDRIVFNFPHAGFFKLKDEDQRQIQLHQDVVRGFMKSACKMLTVDGEVHITHKTAYPFSEWNIEKLGKKAGLELIEEAPFHIAEYPGYINKRGGDGFHVHRANDTFPLGECSTYKFVN